MSRIFVRERSNVGEGAGRPRFAVVAVGGSDLKVYHTHIRRAELEKLAAEIGAEIVYLPRGENAEGEEEAGRRGMGRRHRRGRAGHPE
ncbi:MAG TPA: hypothetical protein VI776_14260 [Anaerolineales bacterium]|jgi:hypothetical protein|nr:hypothetical protein [Anaerolineales bacterium]